MRGFNFVFGRALLDEAFAGILMDKATRPRVEKPLELLKEYAISEEIRISAIEVSEVFQIFLNGKFEIPAVLDPTDRYIFKDELNEYRNNYIGLITNEIEDLKRDTVFLEIFSTMVFDEVFYFKLVNVGSEAQLREELQDCQFEDNEISHNCSNVLFRIIETTRQNQGNDPANWDLTRGRARIEFLKWIRPDGAQISIATGVCWGNITKTELGVFQKNINQNLSYLQNKHVVLDPELTSREILDAIEILFSEPVEKLVK